MRVGGRLEKSSLPESIVRYCHSNEGHEGTSQTLASIRQQFWIVKGPSTVKNIINECIPCHHRNQPPGRQIMAPLSQARVTTGELPFSSVGVDYFGPLKVKYKRATVKRYGTIRNNLRILICERVVGDETLLTVMCEAEKVINDGLLLRQCDDPRDLSALTPNTLLLGHRTKVPQQTSRRRHTTLEKD